MQGILKIAKWNFLFLIFDLFLTGFYEIYLHPSFKSANNIAPPIWTVAALSIQMSGATHTETWGSFDS